MIKTINMADALHSLAPGSFWKYNDEDYSTLEWLSDDIPIPSEDAVIAEIARLQKLLNEEQDAIVQKEMAKEAAKQSAILKLAALGLTEEEAKAIVGV